MSACPNSTASGCKCPEHALGLAAHAPDQAAYLAALRRIAKPARRRLAAVPTPADQRPAGCAGTMTCPCSTCARGRGTRAAIGDGPAAFHVKPATRAA